jgi:hypothetical protein
VTIDGLDGHEPTEDMRIREALDSELERRPETNSVDVSAMVIFPYKPWIRQGRPPCEEFSKWCLEKYIPRLKALNSHNRRGLYFERMMSHEYYDSSGRLCQHNQLQYVVDWWRARREDGRRPRRSGLQVTCFNPRQDHNRMPRLEFPCLQQIGLTYDCNDSDSLAVNAFYPTQFVVDRAYGNYLGLCHLGTFLAREIGVKLVRMTCFVGCAQLGARVTRSSLEPLLDSLQRLLPSREM